MRVLTVFSSGISMNYMTALCIDVVFRLNKRIFPFNRMKIVYHTLCIGLAGFLLVLAEIRGDYGNSQLNTCSLVGTSVSEYVRLGIFAAEIIVM